MWSQRHQPTPQTCLLLYPETAIGFVLASGRVKLTPDFLCNSQRQFLCTCDTAVRASVLEKLCMVAIRGEERGEKTRNSPAKAAGWFGFGIAPFRPLQTVSIQRRQAEAVKLTEAGYCLRDYITPHWSPVFCCWLNKQLFAHFELNRDDSVELFKLESGTGLRWSPLHCKHQASTAGKLILSCAEHSKTSLFFLSSCWLPLAEVSNRF